MRRRSAILGPSILKALDILPTFVVCQPVTVKADKLIIDAARQVAAAIASYDQARFSGLGEVSARLAIERTARTLKSRLEQREAEISQLKQNNRKPKETSNGSTAR